MAFHIRDAETDNAVRKLAAITGLSLTEAVYRAAVNELERMHANQILADKEKTLFEVVKEIQDELAQYPRTGHKADKEFFDDLSGGI